MKETRERHRTEMRREVDEAIDWLNAMTAKVDAELLGVRSELARLRTLEKTVDSKCDPAARLQ